MRRTERQIKPPEALSILEKGEYGILGMIHPDGAPYAVPLNYCVHDNRICFHCAATGLKLDSLEAHNSVSFCVVGDTEVLPGSFGTLYESCIVRGRASEMIGDEKQAALEALLRKYSGISWNPDCATSTSLRRKPGFSGFSWMRLPARPGGNSPYPAGNSHGTAGFPGQFSFPEPAAMSPRSLRSSSIRE